MKKNIENIEILNHLREKTKILLNNKDLKSKETFTREEVNEIIEQLTLYEIELEVQNEELSLTQTNLEQQKNTYQGLFHSAPFGYLIIDQTGKVFDLNKEGQKYVRASSKNPSIFQKLDKESQKSFRHFIIDAFEYKKDIKDNLVFVDEDKKIFTKILLKSFYDDSYKRNVARLVIQDISNTEELKVQLNHSENQILDEKNKAEKSLKNFETFFNSLDDFLFILDDKGKILHANNTVVERLGFPLNELIGMNVIAMHPPKRRTEAAQIVMEMIQGTKDSCPIPLLTRYNKEIPVETKISFGEWNNQPAIFGISKDITETKLSEEKFSKVFRNNQTMNLIMDRKSRKIVDVNKTFCETFEMQCEEIINQKIIDIGILTNEQLFNLTEKFREKEYLSNYEIQLQTKSNKTIYLVTSFEKIYVQEKEMIYMSALDITEKKNIELKLKESEKLFKSFFYENEAIMLLIDPNSGNIIDANKSALKFYKYDYNEITKIKISNINMLDKDSISKKMKNVVSHEENIFTFNHKLANGEIRNVDVFSTKIKTEKGDVLFSIIFDVTDKKIAEQKLIESQNTLEMALFASKSGMWDWNIKTGEVIFDQTLTKMLNYELNEFTPNLSSWSNLIHPDDKELVNTEIKKLLDGEIDFYRTVHRLKTKSGNWKWILDSGKVIEFDVDGNPLRAVGTHQDITFQKEMELELRDYEVKLKENLAAKDKFFDIIAHDLRSPFTALLGMSQMIIEEKDEIEKDELDMMLGSIYESSKSALRLTENLLNWSRTQTGRIPYKPIKSVLYDIIENSIQSLSEFARSKKIKIEKTFQYTGLEVFVDTDMMETVVRNLISNSIKFSNEKDIISLSLEEKDEKIIISISDNGVGMNDYELNKLFKVDQTFSKMGTGKEKGTGLGLILCKEFIEKNNGDIWVESEENVGTTFYFSLPKLND